MSLLSLIDHVAITVGDIAASTAFYDRLFGSTVQFDHAPDGRSLIRSIRIGGAVQLNLHQHGNGFELVAARPTPGSIDICFRLNRPIAEGIMLLQEHGIALVDGPSPRAANDGCAAQSIYFRDPDGNLIELMATD